MKHRRTITIGLCLSLLLAAADGHAQLGKVSQNQLVITAVRPDSTTITIAGANFGSSPAVFLNGMPLDGVTVNAAGIQITATLPILPAGTYLLHVSTGNGTPQNGTFNVTIGATGPQGSAGPQGNVGAQGLAGAPGAAGPAGAQGAIGSQGPQGATGSEGPQGVPGPTGAAGTDGAPGAAGADGAPGAAGADGAPGAAGSDGAQGAIGPTGPQGAAGADGTPGAVGATGPQGPQGLQGAQGTTGPMGLQGPAGAAVPSAPPPAYGGTFVLMIEGQAVTLTSFAGCFDKIQALEYEDCYMSVRNLNPLVMDWFNDTATGFAPVKNLTVYQVNPANQAVISVTDIGGAFLRDFSVADFDATANSNGTLSFVVVPSFIDVSSGVGIAPTVSGSGPTYLSSSFVVDLDGVQGNFFVNVDGLHMSVPKNPVVPQVGRRVFTPGAPAFSDISLDAATGGTTVSDLQAWVSEAVKGEGPRDGQIDILNTAHTMVIGQINLFDLAPVTFSPYVSPSGRRTIILHMGRFELGL